MHVVVAVMLLLGVVPFVFDFGPGRTLTDISSFLRTPPA